MREGDIAYFPPRSEFEVRFGVLRVFDVSCGEGKWEEGEDGILHQIEVFFLFLFFFGCRFMLP